MECLLPYLCMVTISHIMVGLEKMLDYSGVGLVRFHCTLVFEPYRTYACTHKIRFCVLLVILSFFLYMHTQCYM